jgi:glutathione-specific gamma-glutamylcyclotransferase
MKPSPRQMELTAELVAKTHRIELDEGPRPDRQQMDDEDYRDFTNQLLAELGGAPLRVFAYGSLIWKPEFEFVKQNSATLKGWHRSFCMKIERWRGTRAMPGLMMALDTGGSCEGIIYELPHDDYIGQLEKLLRREMTNKPPTNFPKILEIASESETIRVLTFTASRGGYSYQGELPLPEVAAILAQAAGHWGSGAEYLYNTVSHLEQLGIHDDNLWKLQRLVAMEIKKTS